MPALDLAQDVVTLTRTICDVESVSGHEGPLVDGIEQALRALAHLRVDRDGDAVVARTMLGRDQRVLLAGHVDTVPLAARPNLPTWVEGSGDDALVYGRGTCDMKGGVAVQLALAATLTEPTRDVTYVFYDGEEIESEHNGLGRLVRNAPEWLEAGMAVLLEPTDGVVEGGCNGTMRVDVTTKGLAAHSARAWLGHNAIHDAGEVLGRLARYTPQEVEVDGLVYRESLNAVRIRGGVAGNVIPDSCTVEVNYRFAPSTSGAQAEAHLRDLLRGFDVVVTDLAEGARPGLDRPEAEAFVAAMGGRPKPKYGWTDVARFSALGVPAVNYGPGDPMKAHADDEVVPARQVVQAERALRRWLTT